MSIYQRSQKPRPDSEFEPGQLSHLVTGRAGRLLDARRTPVKIVAIEPEFGTFSVRIEGFEDEGAVWKTEFENVGHYQFGSGGSLASEADVARFEAAIAKFDRNTAIPRNDDARDATETAIRSASERARSWLEDRSVHGRQPPQLPDPSTRIGVPELWSDLEAFMDASGLSDIEAEFARQFVSNPHSGDLVKGHRMVMAEIGLASYEGKIARHPDVFEGAWSRARRSTHIVTRIGFVREVLAGMGHTRLMLFRGLSTDAPMIKRRGRTLISATTSEAVAMSHYHAYDDAHHRTLQAQSVPVERVFMSYLETRAMNRQFKEAEVILFADDDSLSF